MPAQDYMIWEKERWSGKARRASEAAQRRADMEAAAEIEDKYKQKYRDPDFLREKEKFGWQKDAQIELERQRQDFQKSQTAEARAAEVGLQDTLRERKATGLAQKYMSQIDPVTGVPHTQASALARGKMDLLEAEGAESEIGRAAGQSARASMPHIKPLADSRADLQLDTDLTKKYGNSLDRAKAAFGLEAEAGRLPYAREAAAEGIGAEIETSKGQQASGRMIQRDPRMGVGGVASAITRGEQDRRTILEDEASKKRLIDAAKGKQMIKPPKNLSYDLSAAPGAGGSQIDDPNLDRDERARKYFIAPRPNFD